MKALDPFNRIPTWFLLVAYHAARASLDRRLEERPAFTDAQLARDCEIAAAVFRLRAELSRREARFPGIAERNRPAALALVNVRQPQLERAGGAS